MLTIFLLLAACAAEPVRMSRAEAGALITRVLKAGPTAPRDEHTRRALAQVRSEALTHFNGAKRKGALNVERAELAERLRVLENRLEPVATVPPELVFETMELLAEKDLLNTIDAQLGWEQTLNTARRVRQLLIAKLGAWVDPAER